MMYDIYRTGQHKENTRTILDNISTGLGMMIVYISYMSVATVYGQYGFQSTL